MRQLDLAFDKKYSSTTSSLSHSLPYLSPEVEVQHVELEAVIAASVRTSEPIVNDPTDGGDKNGDVGLW